MIMKRSTYHNFLTIASVLLVLIPLALVSGPFLPDLFIVFISIIFLFISSSNKELNLFQSNFFKLFLLFYLYLILTSLLSNNFYQSFKPSITYLSFGLYYLAIIFLMLKNPNLKKYFYMFVYFTIIILLLDGFFQFITGKNVFGYKVVRPDRLGGLFFDELILGSFLSKILPVYCSLYALNKKYFNKYYFLIIIIFVYLLIFLSGERSAFLTTTLYLLMIAPFIFKIKQILAIITCSTFVFVALINLNENIKSRYYDQMIMHTFNITNENEKKFLPEHIGLFSSAINIFKKNILFGGGVKTFRINCKDSKYVDVVDFSKLTEKRNKNCSTHPHNFYLQLLAEVGIFGFLFILGIFVKLFYDYFEKLYFYIKKGVFVDKSNILILCGLITFLWPITTTGSFFNNWVCSILFLQVGIYLYTLKIISSKNEH